eukprot:3196591-Amphidinium_carterae.1
MRDHPPDRNHRATQTASNASCRRIVVVRSVAQASKRLANTKRRWPLILLLHHTGTHMAGPTRGKGALASTIHDDTTSDTSIRFCRVSIAGV